MNRLLWGATALILGALWGAEQFARPTVAIVGAGQTAAGPPMTDRERWAVDLLAGVGNTQPSAEIVGFVVAWSCAEDVGAGALLRNNPLNTTLCGFGHTGAINGDGACGVGGYPTYDDGLGATLATLAQQNFSGITAALQQNDAPGALQALVTSEWAASHYDNGRSWPHGGC